MSRFGLILQAWPFCFGSESLIFIRNKIIFCVSLWKRNISEILAANQACIYTKISWTGGEKSQYSVYETSVAAKGEKRNRMEGKVLKDETWAVYVYNIPLHAQLNFPYLFYYLLSNIIFRIPFFFFKLQRYTQGRFIQCMELDKLFVDREARETLRNVKLSIKILASFRAYRTYAYKSIRRCIFLVFKSYETRDLCAPPGLFPHTWTCAHRLYNPEDCNICKYLYADLYGV